MLGTTVTTGNTEVSLEQGVSLENTSVKYEVETALNDSLKVASSIEIEKSNQAPVDGSDDRNGERGVIQSFHVKKPPFPGFCIVFLSLPVSL